MSGAGPEEIKHFPTIQHAPSFTDDSTLSTKSSDGGGDIENCSTLIQEILSVEASVPALEDNKFFNSSALGCFG